MNNVMNQVQNGFNLYEKHLNKTKQNKQNCKIECSVNDLTWLRRRCCAHVALILIHTSEMRTLCVMYYMSIWEHTQIFSNWSGNVIAIRNLWATTIICSSVHIQIGACAANNWGAKRDMEKKARRKVFVQFLFLRNGEAPPQWCKHFAYIHIEIGVRR